MVRDQLQQVENNMDVEVQCRLADRNHELIMGMLCLIYIHTDCTNSI